MYIKCKAGCEISRINQFSDNLQHVDLLADINGELAAFQIQLTEEAILHPKAIRLSEKISHFRRQPAKDKREKKLIVLIKEEFATVSVEVMDVLSAIPQLSGTVFALAPKHRGDIEYLRAVELRYVQ